MKVLSYLNPFFIYERRHLVPVYLRNYVMDAKRMARPVLNRIRARLAENGLPLTVDDARLASLKDLHRGQRAFVIGTGKSLKIADLERLESEITFASNLIYAGFRETSWRPTYYATTYLEYKPGFYSEIAAIERSVKLLPLAARTQCPPVRGAIYFRHTHEVFYPRLPRFSHNALETVYWGGTITYILIQFAVYMGIREIYLLGVDFDYGTIPASEGVKPGDPFVVTSPVNSYFHPTCVQRGDKFYLPVLHLHALAYEAARLGVSAVGGTIYNATRGGKLEIFPRVNFDQLFS